MFSLAPFLYRNISAEQGGPVEQVQICAVPVFGQQNYQALAFLKPGLVDKAPYAMYGSADGTGTAEIPAVAQHKAISEALERWALDETWRLGNESRYGFDVDRCSNGMAAFPGFTWQAKRQARLEALERFALIGWWGGYLPAEEKPSGFPNITLFRIDHGQSGGEVVVIYHKTAAGFYAYGHSSGSTLEAAASKAVVELARNEYVISRYRAAGSLAPVQHHFERRVLYFSTPEGHAEFLSRTTAKPSKPRPKWKTVFNGEIPGPWSQWAKVWRHCVEMPTYDFLDRDQNFFFW
jgi:hypothetical protein